MTHPPIPSRPAVFLDFDGTLVDIAETPDAIVVPPELPDILQRVQERVEGALAIVSGRRIAEIDHHLAPLALPAAGLHGIEQRRRDGGTVLEMPASEQLAVLHDRLAHSGLISGGVSLEDKGAGLAVHYRRAPERGDAVIDTLRDIARDLDELHLIEGKMVVEAKRGDVNKGTAITDFMTAAPFLGRTPVFLGDDVTDEDGFRIVAGLDGVPVKIGDGFTDAPFRLAGSRAVMDWLHRLANPETSLAS